MFSAAHTHPEVADEHARATAAHLTALRCCAEAGCPARATLIVTLTMPATLARIPVPFCAHHGVAFTDEHHGLTAADGRPIATLTSQVP